MASKYVVQDGDHLPKIAAKFGFRNHRTLWNDPGNAALKILRKNPNVLRPGDVIAIPDREARTESVDTGQRHHFILGADRLMLRIVRRDRFDHAHAGQKATLAVGDRMQVTSDARGLLERRIPISAEDGRLRAGRLQGRLRIGHLQPVDVQPGWQARLNNLGYDAGPIGVADPAELRSAIEEFQCDFGLQVSGQMDQVTMDRLLREHGC